MNVVNMEAFDRAVFNRDPWSWGVLNDLVGRDDVGRIRAEILRLDFHGVAAEREDKRYRMQLFEVAADYDEPTRLGDLLSDLRSDAYVGALENYAGVPLADRRRSINIWRYSKQDYLSAHLDKPEKYLTQLLYFNEDWSLDHGGTLNILASAEESSVAASILPSYRNSAVIVTGDKSWHSVSPVSAEGAERYCLQYIFWDDRTGPAHPIPVSVSVG